MFLRATAFNQNIGGWNTSAVTNMGSMFYGVTTFNQDISGWNTGAVTTMQSMFYDATAFNNGGANLDWNDTSSVTSMASMFLRATAFNQDISGWNTGAVTTMKNMFYSKNSASTFNNGGVALDWSDTGSVTSMQNMFYDATAFNQDISGWNVSNVTTMKNMFHNVTLPTENYDALLIAWDALELQNNVAFSGGNSKYTTGSAAARANIIATDSWTITDGGSIPSMTITSAEVTTGATSNDATLSLTFTASEATTDFVEGDITLSGGALSDFAASSSAVYTATFTPTTDGAASIDVAASKFTDASGNNNTAANQFNWTYDSTAPTLSSSTPLDDATGVAVDANIILIFSEAVAVESGTITLKRTSDN